MQATTTTTTNTTQLMKKAKWDTKKLDSLITHPKIKEISDRMSVRIWNELPNYDDKFRGAQTQGTMANIRAECDDDGFRTSVYSTSESHPDGRLFEKGGLGYQGCSRWIRSYCVPQGYYKDIDMVNCGPTILLLLALKNGFPEESLDALREYVEQRETVLNRVTSECGIDRGQAKHIFIVSTHGGNYAKELNSIENRTASTSTHLQKYQDTMRNLAHNFMALPQFEKEAKQAPSPGSFLCCLWQQIETKIMLAFDEEIPGVDVFCFDGALLQSSLFNDDAIKKFEVAIAEQLGFPPGYIKFVVKEFFRIPAEIQRLLDSNSKPRHQFYWDSPEEQSVSFSNFAELASQQFHSYEHFRMAVTALIMQTARIVLNCGGAKVKYLIKMRQKLLQEWTATDFPQYKWTYMANGKKKGGKWTIPQLIRDWNLESKLQYERVTPFPSSSKPSATTEAFSMWTGFKAKVIENPDKECIDTFEAVLLQCICGGCWYTFRWIVKFLAFILRNPGEQTGKMLVVFGEGGQAKSLMFQDLMFQMIPLGTSGHKIEGTRKLSGESNHFNSEFQGKIYTVIEEAKQPSYTKLIEFCNAIKEWITSSQVSMVKKYAESSTEQNGQNFVLLSNFDNAVPLLDSGMARRIVYCQVATAEETFKGGDGQPCDCGKCPANWRKGYQAVFKSQEEKEKFFDKWAPRFKRDPHFADSIFTYLTTSEETDPSTIDFRATSTMPQSEAKEKARYHGLPKIKQYMLYLRDFLNQPAILARSAAFQEGAQMKHIYGKANDEEKVQFWLGTNTQPYETELPLNFLAFCKAQNAKGIPSKHEFGREMAKQLQKPKKRTGDRYYNIREMELPHDLAQIHRNWRGYDGFDED